MSESVKEKIFDHFFTTKGVGKGKGLGLAIANPIIVEKYGGTLNVNSTLTNSHSDSELTDLKIRLYDDNWFTVINA